MGKNKRSKVKDNAAVIKKWKPPIYLYCCLLVIGFYLALVTASQWEEGDTIFTIIGKMMDFIDRGSNWINIKFDWKYLISRPKILGTSVLVYEFTILFFILLDVSKNRNFMRGKEYGTANWASVQQINKKFENVKNPSWNRVYSENLRIGMKTSINNNVLAIGGSGVGKSFYFLTPNIYQADPDSQYPGSLVFTDPKGELLQNNGAYLKNKGYVVKCLNLVPGMMHESDKFNPFRYIRSEADITKIINNIFVNTTEKGATPSEPFWEKAEFMFLQSLFLIVWMESERFGWEKSLNTVLWLMSKAEISDDADEESELDEIFNQLVLQTMDEKGKGIMHPAYLAYHKVMVGAADTKRSIVISANARFAIFENPEVKRILSDDELDLAGIGTGLVDGRKNVKTALFCVIPDADTSYNCIAGMLYTLLFQELYFQADFKYGGKLPVPVTFWLDEFANIALPRDFIKLLATMRSRLISCVIIIQNLAQIKALFEKEWESLVGNCDVCVYLGGNEQSTFEYISKNLGKKTIFKQSHGETTGIHGSSNKNEDVLGRELMLPEEVRELDNDYCIVFVRGKKPIFDHKYRTLESPEFLKSQQLGAYLHSQQKEMNQDVKIALASKQEIADVFKNGNLIDINLNESLMQHPGYIELMDIVIQNKEEEEAEREKKKVIDIQDMDVMELLQHPDFVLSDAEIVEVTEGIKNGLSDAQIKEYILYDDVKRMRSQRLLFEALNARQKRNEG